MKSTGAKRFQIVMVALTLEISLISIDPGKWFQIVMTGLTLEISFILVSVMTKNSKTKHKATPVATPVESDLESNVTAAEEPHKSKKSKKAKRDHHGKK